MDKRGDHDHALDSDGTSTHWSDVQWNPSPASTHPRPSAEEPNSRPTSHDLVYQQNAQLLGPTHLQAPMSQRNSPAPRVLHMESVDDTLRPGMGMGMGNGYAPYPHDHYAQARSRRKSVAPDSEEDELPSAGKKKRRSVRGAFSFPFTNGRRRIQPLGFWSSKRRSKCLFSVLLLCALLYGFIIWRRAYDVQVEFSIFSRKWIATEIDSIQPLQGCFNPDQISPRYDLSKHLAPRRQLLSPGISLKRGMSCYDFASTIQPVPDVPLEHVYYHTYWRSDLIPFGERQTATFLAFLATQPLSHSTLILWTNGADTISSSPFVKPFLEKWGQYIQVRQVDLDVLAQGTALAGVIGGLTEGGKIYDERAWVDGDAIRLLVLWNYGGVWMDMDQLLTRDLHHLTEEEWVTQWDCYDKPYFSFNGALMHFLPHSPYLCEAFHLMSTSPLPKPNTFTWGAHLYAKLHRQLIAANIRPFAVLPWCFSDPRNCRLDNRLPDPFLPDPQSFAGRPFSSSSSELSYGEKSGQEILEEKTSHIYSIHLHNQWFKPFPSGGWIDRLLEGYRAQVGRVERYAQMAGMVVDGKVVLRE